MNNQEISKYLPVQDKSKAPNTPTNQQKQGKKDIVFSCAKGTDGGPQAMLKTASPIRLSVIMLTIVATVKPKHKNRIKRQIIHL